MPVNAHDYGPPAVRAAFGLVAAGLSVVTFHAGAWWVMHLLGAMPPPFPLSPTAPLGVPLILSLVFWGALYGIPFGLALPVLPRPLVLCGFGLGLLACLVGWFVVAPLKGRAPASGPVEIPLVLNGAWGVGVGLILPWLLRLRAPRMGGAAA